MLKKENNKLYSSPSRGFYQIERIEGADLEKAASGASGVCGHFVGNRAILRTFGAKYPVLFTEDGKTRVEDGELRFDKEHLR